MQAFQLESKVTEDRALQLTDLPFAPGSEVTITISPRGEEADASSDSLLVREWTTASQSALRDVWDNDEDAAYDRI